MRYPPAVQFDGFIIGKTESKSNHPAVESA